MLVMLRKSNWVLKELRLLVIRPVVAVVNSFQLYYNWPFFKDLLLLMVKEAGNITREWLSTPLPSPHQVTIASCNSFRHFPTVTLLIARRCVYTRNHTTCRNCSFLCSRLFRLAWNSPYATAAVFSLDKPPLPPQMLVLHSKGTIDLHFIINNYLFNMCCLL